MGLGTMANSEDPDEMPHVAAFQQGMRCLLINLQRKKFIIFINYNRSPLNIYIGPSWPNCFTFCGKFHWS